MLNIVGPQHFWVYIFLVTYILIFLNWFAYGKFGYLYISLPKHSNFKSFFLPASRLVWQLYLPNIWLFECFVAVILNLYSFVQIVSWRMPLGEGLRKKIMVGPHPFLHFPCFASRLHFKFLPNNLLGNKAPLVRNMYNSLTHLLKISNLHSIINIQKSLNTQFIQ